MTASLRARPGSPFARLYAVGAFLPSRVVDNAEMCTYIDSTAEWIEQRTGIVERRWVAEGETVLSMSVASARVALERSGIDPASVDGLIVSTISHFEQTPALATLVAAELGLSDPVAFDVAGACAGFCLGLAQAESLVRTGACRFVLVVGVEAMSQLTNLSDRGTAFLFADGAGAALVGPSDVNGIGPVVWGSDGAQADAIRMNVDSRSAVQQGEAPYLTMNGQAVFRWATGFIADAAQRALEASGLTADQLDVFVPHQANNRIIDSMLRHLKLPDRVVVARSIKTMGNTSAASIPLAIDELLSNGQAKSGDTALLIGFGAGLVYAGQVVVLP